jgi:hypothetical protein
VETHLNNFNKTINRQDYEKFSSKSEKRNNQYLPYTFATNSISTQKKCDLSNLRNDDIMEIGPIPSITMLVREYHIANQPTSHHNQCYEEILSTINLMKY